MTRPGRLSRQDHRTLRGSGFRASSGPVVVHAFNTEPEPKIGFAVGTGIGKAVVRNRIRRRLAAAARTLSWQGAVVVSARADASRIPFPELCRHLETALTSAQGRARA